jgi:hypothetical protein
MKISDEFVDLLYRTVRAIPTFVCVATAAVIIVYETGSIPSDKTAILLGVPMVWGFMIIRILGLILPEGPRKAAIRGGTKHVSFPVWFAVCLVILFASSFGAVDGTFSAATFRLMGLKDFARLALTIASIATGCTGGVVVIVSLYLLRNTVLEMWEAMLLGTWEILLIPRRLADRIPGMVQNGHRDNQPFHQSFRE